MSRRMSAAVFAALLLCCFQFPLHADLPNPLGDIPSSEKSGEPGKSEDDSPKMGDKDLDSSKPLVEDNPSTQKKNPDEISGGISEMEDRPAFGANAADPGRRRPSNDGGAFWGTATRLGLTLGALIALFMGLMWMLKKFVPGIKDMGGNQVIRVISRSYLGPKHQLALVRVASKVLLVGISGENMRTLTEISDPEEIRKLEVEMEVGSKTSVSSSFKSMFGKINKDYDGTLANEVREEDEDFDRVRGELDDIRGKIRNWHKENKR